jgi:uncharacterized membrane protein
MSAVPDDGDTPRRRRLLDKGRMEAFSDGVFGFAATLLVVDLALRPGGTALQQVLHAWPSFVAYIISFLTIGTAWLAHTSLTDRLARIDPVFLRLNLLALLAVVFLPFPTRLVAEALSEISRERVFVSMFGLTLLAIRILGPPWTRMRGTSTSTQRTKITGTRMTGSCTVTSENCCPSSSGM